MCCNISPVKFHVILKNYFNKKTRFILQDCIPVGFVHTVSRRISAGGVGGLPVHADPFHAHKRERADLPTEGRRPSEGRPSSEDRSPSEGRQTRVKT